MKSPSSCAPWMVTFATRHSHRFPEIRCGTGRPSVWHAMAWAALIPSCVLCLFRGRTYWYSSPLIPVHPVKLRIDVRWHTQNLPAPDYKIARLPCLFLESWIRGCIWPQAGWLASCRPMESDGDLEKKRKRKRKKCKRSNCAR